MDYQILTNSEVTISTYLVHNIPQKYLVTKGIPKVKSDWGLTLLNHPVHSQVKVQVANLTSI